jgi:hypothetical protein
MKYQKYVFGIIVFFLFFIFSPALALNTNGKNIPQINPNIRMHGGNFVGVITAVNSDSYTVSIKRGANTFTQTVKFDAKTKFNVLNRNVSRTFLGQNPQNIGDKKNPAKFTAPTATDLKAGDTVRIIGRVNSDNTIEARMVHQMPTPKTPN